MKTFYTLIAVLFLSINHSEAQLNFNNYEPLRSKGEMPNDFKLAVKAKIEQNDIDLSSIEKKDQTEFLEQIHYGIDQMLNSGSVTFGNDVCKYIEAVGDKLLADDKSLRSKLRFYVVKSNVANAFATNQGMIFFTTGLIAQFSTEAQLAYVLAHEIIHFKHNHVIQSYEMSKSGENSLAQLSQYSKEHEFEADREAVEMCHKAGYSKDEVLGTLDVLMFSHLPFDEIKFDFSYYNTDKFFIPDEIFSKKEYQINMDESYNDSLSTHPNIERRRAEVDKTIEKFSNWGSELYLLGDAKFKEIRNICRFETVRNRIVHGEIPYALYEIYTLEKEFPNSESLQGFKAHAWYDLVRLRINSNWRGMFPKEKELEGASGQFFHFLMNQKADQTYTLALRNVYDLKNKFPENEYIANIYEKTVRILSKENRLKTNKYYDLTFKEAEAKIAQSIEEAKNKAADTVAAVVEEQKVEENKYTRIRRSGTKTTEGAAITSIDSVNYHLYGISDILADEVFKGVFKEFYDENNAPPLASNKKTSKRQSKNELPSNFTVTGTLNSKEKLILTKPLIFTNSSENSGKRNVEVKPIVVDAIDYALRVTKTNYVKIGGNSGDDEYTTEELNNNAFVQDLLIQISDLDNNSAPIVPIDYNQTQLLMSKFGSKKIAYFFYGENPKSKVHFGKVFGFIWCPAIFVKNVLEETTARHRSIAAVYTFDLETGMHNATAALKISSKPTKQVLRSSMYNLIHVK